MLADIASGNTGAADTFFLVALIIFIVGFVTVLLIRPVVIHTLCLFAGLACVAFAWLLL